MDEPKKERFTFDVPFSDILHKVAKVNKSNKSAYIYVPEGWDGYEIALLKLGKKAGMPGKIVVGEPIPKDDNNNLREEAQEWKEQAAFWQTKATDLEVKLRKKSKKSESKPEPMPKPKQEPPQPPEPEQPNEEELLLRSIGL